MRRYINNGKKNIFSPGARAATFTEPSTAVVLKKNFLFFLLFFLQLNFALAQDGNPVKHVRFASHYTSFPDSVRANGHTYDSVYYGAKDHYADSSVLLLVPKTLSAKRRVDLVFWFHGWNNNIDTANAFYGIEKQFRESGRNAVLVLAETARNAPDSYGGKLEQKGVFRRLVADVLQHLKGEKLIGQKAVAGNITLAGHSGAYRVIAYVLANGEAPVAKVFLFDALYSQTDKFLSWIEQDKEHRFVNWYTDQGGGTDEVSLQMMQLLSDRHLPYRLVEEPALTSQDIKKSRILFVHSPREHNVIINHPDNLRSLLTIH